MSTFAAIAGAFFSVLVVYLLAKNIGSSSKPTSGPGRDHRGRDHHHRRHNQVGPHGVGRAKRSNGLSVC